MAVDGILLSPDDARILRQVVADYRSKRPYNKAKDSGSRYMPERVLKPAKLTATLATGSLTSPSTAAAEFYKFNSSNQLVVSGDTFTVTNYSADLDGASGDFCIVARVGSVWMIIAKDC